MGKIELDHTGSGGGITLSSDGTSLLLDGTAVGGSALELYAENPSSPTAPSATGTNAVAIGTQTTASGNDSITAGSFSSATAYAASAFGVTAVAAGSYSVAIGRGRAGGGTSLSAVIDNNTSSYGATGNNSIAMGYQAKATSSGAVGIGYQAEATGLNYPVAIGGSNPEAADNYTVVIGGFSNRVTEDYSVIVGGYDNTVTGQYNFVGGGREHSIPTTYTAAFGQRVYSRTNYGIILGSDQFNGAGRSQAGRYILSCTTTDATATQMTSGGAAAAALTFFQLQDAGAATFSGLIVGRESNSVGTSCVAFKIEGLLVRGSGVATVSLVNSAITVIDNTPGWGGVSLSAETTYGGLKINVTGAASTNIRWVCTLDTSEVTYA